MLMINLGGLDEVPMEWRDMLAKPLQKWADLCVATGQMEEGAGGEEEEEKAVAAPGTRVI
jgi:hypothetical protein